MQMALSYISSVGKQCLIKSISPVKKPCLSTFPVRKMVRLKQLIGLKGLKGRY